jgi:hypothetical protein
MRNPNPYEDGVDVAYIWKNRRETMIENMPSHEVMQALTKMVVEQFTEELAMKAREFAKNTPDTITGPQALIAFADSIQSTNSKLYPKQR